MQRAAEADEQAERAALQRAPSRASVGVVGSVPASELPADFEPEPEPEPEQAAAEQPNVERTLYKPEDPDWLAQEERLMQRMKRVNEEREKKLLAEPPGIDDVLVQGGFDIPSATPPPGAVGSDATADTVLSSVQEQVVSVSRRPGYDLVRVCNIDDDPERTPQEIAFFHHRGTLDAFDHGDVGRAGTCSALAGVPARQILAHAHLERAETQLQVTQELGQATMDLAAARFAIIAARISPLHPHDPFSA